MAPRGGANVGARGSRRAWVGGAREGEEAGRREAREEREARRLSEHPEKETDSPARDRARGGGASWITDDDVETFFLSEPDPLGVGAFFHGVGTWAANRREQAAARRRRPPLQVVRLTDADRERLRLGCDEMHFLPVPDSGWSVALLRYTPASNVTHFPLLLDAVRHLPRTPCGRLGFRRAAPARPTRKNCRRCSFRASNAYTFDVAPSFSLARALAREGHDVFVVECRRGLLAPVCGGRRASGRTRRRTRPGSTRPRSGTSTTTPTCARTCRRRAGTSRR